MTTDSYTAKLTSIPPAFYPNIPSKTPTGQFGRSDQYAETLPSKSRSLHLQLKSADSSNVIVIDAGSRFLKIGRASDPLPKIIPHLIARPKTCISDKDLPESKATGDHSQLLFQNSSDEFYSEAFKKLFEARMHFLKRKPMPSAPNQVHNFNSNVQPNCIAEHNDLFIIDWIDPMLSDAGFYCGDEAKYLDNSSEKFIHKYPIRNATFNLVDYSSIHEVLSDLYEIWRWSLDKYFAMHSRKDYENAFCLLIVPDSVTAEELKWWSVLALKLLNFSAVAFLQQSVAAAFGSGTASACVVDMGSQHISFACVDEGFILEDSMISLPYGGDSLTKLFLEFLIDAGFPYEKVQLEDPVDFDLISELKFNSITLQESDTFNISTFEFYVRRPMQPTLHYNVKMYEERIMTALALFVSNSVPMLSVVNRAKTAVNNDTDEMNQTVIEDKGSESTFDSALMKCISGNATNAESLERIKKFASSVILVGGECFIPHLNEFVQQRMSQMFKEMEGLADTSLSYFKGPSKDLDSKMISWKGGCVFSKIESSQDYWICLEEYEAKSMQAISKRVNFIIRTE